MKKILGLGFVIVLACTSSLVHSMEHTDPFPRPQSIAQASWNSLSRARRELSQVNPALVTYLNLLALEEISKRVEAARNQGIRISIVDLNSASDYVQLRKDLFNKEQLAQYQDLINKWSKSYVQLIGFLFSEFPMRPDLWAVDLPGDMSIGNQHYYKGKVLDY